METNKLVETGQQSSKITTARDLLESILSAFEKPHLDSNQVNRLCSEVFPEGLGSLVGKPLLFSPCSLRVPERQAHPSENQTTSGSCKQSEREFHKTAPLFGKLRKDPQKSLAV